MQPLFLRGVRRGRRLRRLRFHRPVRAGRAAFYVAPYIILSFFEMGGLEALLRK